MKCGIFWFSLWGLGHLLLDVCCPKAFAQNALPMGVFGFGTFIVIGGCLTSVHWVSLPALSLFLLVGVLRAAWAIKPKLNQSYAMVSKVKSLAASHPALSLLSVVVFCFCLYECALFYRPFFNIHDDYHSYLISIQRLLQQGWFGFEPFNLRLLVSAIGAHSFFTAYAFVLADEELLYLYEFVIGSLMLLEVMWCHIHLSRHPKRWWVWAVVLSVFIAQNMVNVTSTFTAISLLYFYLVLALYGAETGLSSKRLLATKGLVAATVFCLKTTLVPSLAIVMLLDAFLSKDKSMLQWRNVVFFGSVLVLLALPWCYAHYEATGSFFYPYLGKGYLCFDFPTYLLDGNGTLGERLFAVLRMLGGYSLFQLTVAILCCAFLLRGRKTQMFEICLLLSPWLVGGIILGKTGAYDFGFANQHLRYAAPLAQTAILFWFANEAPKLESELRPERRLQLLAGFILLLLWPLVGVATYRYRVTERYWQMKVERERNDALHSPTAALSDVRNAQAAVPPGETIYVRLSRANLLDFSRNPIYVGDFPNQMGLKGCFEELPIAPAKFAKHFLDQGIRYIMYNHRTEGGYPRSVFGRTSAHEWDYYRYGAQMSFALADQLEIMMKASKQLFNNGYQVVIDLGQPAQKP